MRIALWGMAIPVWGMAFLLALPSLSAYLRYDNRAHYRDEVFLVTGAAVTGRMGSQPILRGKVDGQDETYLDPGVPSMSGPAYLKAVPIGTELRIKFNPGMTRMLIANANLRVLKADWNFADDRALVRFFLLYVALPSVLVGVGLFLIRNRARRRPSRFMGTRS